MSSYTSIPGMRKGFESKPSGKKHFQWAIGSQEAPITLYLIFRADK